MVNLVGELHFRLDADVALTFVSDESNEAGIAKRDGKNARNQIDPGGRARDLSPVYGERSEVRRNNDGRDHVQHHKHRQEPGRQHEAEAIRNAYGPAHEDQEEYVCGPAWRRIGQVE